MFVYLQFSKVRLYEGARGETLAHAVQGVCCCRRLSLHACVCAAARAFACAFGILVFERVLVPCTCAFFVVLCPVVRLCRLVVLLLP